MSRKVQFQIVYCTGEDDRFPVDELNRHGPTVNGWRSPSNCPFPQEIILQLKVHSILHKIQILAHQYLIPQKIEICTSEEVKENNCSESFEYLGFVTFSSNVATDFRSRELKSICIPHKAANYVKLRIHCNYKNAKNSFNQVGLIAINVFGEETGFEEKTFSAKSECSNSGVTDMNSYDISPYDDLAFEMYVDRETADIIKFLELRKREAIHENKLNLAEELEITLKRLRKAGEILGRYEQEKLRAITVEDFEEAKTKELLIENFKKKIYAGLQVKRLLQKMQSPEKRESIYISECHKPLMWPSEEIGGTKTNQNCGGNFFSENLRSERYGCKDGRQKNLVLREKNITQINIEPPPAPFWKMQTGPLSSSSSEIDEWHPLAVLNASRPGPGSHISLADSFPNYIEKLYEFPDLKKKVDTINSSISWNDFPSPKATLRKDSQDTIKSFLSEPKFTEKTAKARSAPTENIFNSYEERTLPALRRYHGNEVIKECHQLTLSRSPKTFLNEKEKKQAAISISVFGVEMVEKFYSKNFSDKEESLKELQQKLQNFSKTVGDSLRISFDKVARGSVFLLQRALRDKVFSVYTCAAETIRAFFTDFVPRGVSAPEVARSVEKLLPELIVKSGDVTPRVHNMAAHTLLTMAECKEVRRLHIIPRQLTRPLTSGVHPRLALSRLEMVEQLMLNLGISSDKKSGLTSRTLAEFGSSGLHHPAEAVRKVSERILLRVYKENPRIVRKQLPPDDDVTRRNLQYRQLFREFDVIDFQRKTNEGKPVFVSDPNLTNSSETSVTSQKTTRIREINPNSNNNNINGFFTKFKEETLHQLPVGSKNSLDSSVQKIDLPAKIVKFQIEGGHSKFAEAKTTKEILKLSEFQKKNELSANHNHLGKSFMAKVRKSEGKKSNPSFVSAIPVPTDDFSSRMKNRCPDISIKKLRTQEFSKKNPKMKTSKHVRETKEINDLDHEEKKKEKWILSRSQKTEDNAGEESRLEKETEQNATLSNSMLASIKSFREKKGSQATKTEFKVCIFCLSSSRWTTEESLNTHYLKECLMLTTCHHCKEVIEISELTTHLLTYCKRKHFFQKCTNCEEAVPKNSFASHKCKGVKNEDHKTRCPFCHLILEDEENSLRKHLVENMCSNHPRNKICN